MPRTDHLNDSWGWDSTNHYKNHPVYIEQRLTLRSTFKGKAARIADQFQNFRQEVSPIFFPKTWEKDIIVEDATAQIISNWAAFDVLQYLDRPASAGMSMVHLLAIPRVPILNGVCLTADTVHVIDDMIRLFQDAWARPEVRRIVLARQLDAIERRRVKVTEGEPFANKAYQAALAHYKELESTIQSLDTKNFHYGLNLRPDNSADYLNLHIIAAPYEFRQYSTTEHDEKMKDAIEVRDFIVREAAAISSTVITATGIQHSKIEDNASLKSNSSSSTANNEHESSLFSSSKHTNPYSAITSFDGNSAGQTISVQSRKYYSQLLYPQ